MRGRKDLVYNLTSVTGQPYILNPKHAFTILLVQFHQDKFAHQGKELVRNELRKILDSD